MDADTEIYFMLLLILPVISCLLTFFYVFVLKRKITDIVVNINNASRAFMTISIFIILIYTFKFFFSECYVNAMILTFIVFIASASVIEFSIQYIIKRQCDRNLNFAYKEITWELRSKDYYEHGIPLHDRLRKGGPKQRLYYKGWFSASDFLKYDPDITHRLEHPGEFPNSVIKTINRQSMD